MHKRQAGTDPHPNLPAKSMSCGWPCPSRVGGCGRELVFQERLLGLDAGLQDRLATQPWEGSSTCLCFDFLLG